MNLRDRISRQVSDAIAIVDNSDRITYGQLCSPGLPDDIALFSTVALQFSNVSDLVKALTILDGQVQRIALISSSISAEQLVSLLTSMDADLLLSDKLDTKVLANWKNTCLSFSDVQNKPTGLTHDRGIDTRWLLTTSGSTGTPKVVSHSLESLTRTTKHSTADSAAQRRTWGLLYDPCRFAGLQVVLQSLCSGDKLVEPCRSHDFVEQIRTLSQEKCTHLSATPSLWRKILMADASHSLDLAQVTLGGEIADTNILAALAKRYPAGRVTHVYASTEAGVGFSVSDGKAGFPMNYLIDANAGMDIKVVDNRLYIRNDRVDSQYVGTETGFRDKDGYIDTGDLVTIKGERVLFRGRENGQLNVGGNKVMPEEIEQVFSGCECINAIKVMGKPNPITGTILIAQVVQSPGFAGDSQALKAKLNLFANRNLEKWQRPLLWKIVDDLSMTPAGKILRSGD